MKREFYYPSKDGITQIHAVEWLPEGDAKGVLQILHGMVEHIGRYDEFAEFMASKGYYVIGHDHLGHGKSVVDSDKYGYFGAPDGNAYVVGDIHELRLRTAEKYPDIPYFMLGHSMGSFLTRQYIGIHGKGLSGAIVMGTGEQPSMILAAGKMVCKVIGSLKGWHYRSEFVNNLAVGSYEKKMGRAWLSRNTENVKKYAEDPLSGFLFTVNAYYHMFNGMARMNQQEKDAKMPKSLPVFFVAGAEDLVGNCGKGVRTVCERYKKIGCQDVEIKLYEEDRHEILNELDKELVFADILTWMESKI